MNNQAPTTYGEMYITGAQYFVSYPNLIQVGESSFCVENRNLIEVVETRTTKTGRIAAKLWNKATNRKFWTAAVSAKKACETLHICEGMVSKQWATE